MSFPVPALAGRGLLVAPRHIPETRGEPRPSLPGAGPYIKFLRPAWSTLERAAVLHIIFGIQSKPTFVAMSNADVYRKRAAECQRQADAAVSESVRETLQEIAHKYLVLAANEDWSEAMSGPAARGPGTPRPDARD